MGDDASIQARPRLIVGPGGGASLGDAALDKRPLVPVPAPKSEGDVHRYSRGRSGATPPSSATAPGTELERKKSYHPELSSLRAADAHERSDLMVLPKMEVIHLNRTCTSVDLASAQAARMRSASDEEKVHRVRHQVSFAHDLATEAAASVRGRPIGAELISALRNSSAFRAALGEESDPEHEEDGDGAAEDDRDDPYGFFARPSNLVPDNDVDYLAVRPSLASTQLNEIRGPSGGS